MVIAHSLLVVFIIFVPPTNSSQKRKLGGTKIQYETIGVSFGRGISEALERAIERTKQRSVGSERMGRETILCLRQSTDWERNSRQTLTESAMRAKAARTERTERLDVGRLNGE